MHESLTLPYQASRSPLKKIDASPATCVECVEPIYPSSEITSQCTDKCVVIACNDPGHDEIGCHRAQGNSHCDLVCEGTRGCSDCNGFDEFLQCCTDYHSYFSEPRMAESPSAPMSWDSFDAGFLCGCGEQGQGSADRIHNSFASTEAEIGYMLGNNDILHPSSSSSFIPSQTLALPCMWGNCRACFASLPELVGHVNLEHLRLPPVEAPASVSPNTVSDTQSDSSRPSCLWRNCTEFSTPESIPTSSAGDAVDGFLGILANHLLQDHLGHFPATSSEDSPLTSLTSQSKTNQKNLDEASSASGAERSISPLSSPSHQCTGTHMCNWKSCGQSFTTCSDLTSHLTAVHVGSGKAHYECFWEGCNRSGSNGFSSKQKISRHLQSHTGHRPYQCEICLQNFSEAATLQQHMRRHTQEKPYKCDYPGCGKSFAITGALTIHKRMHNGHKPFKCKFCDRAFAESSNLSKHLRTHTGVRPYPCTEPGCNKAFARPDQLSRHMGIHKKGNRANEV